MKFGQKQKSDIRPGVNKYRISRRAENDLVDIADYTIREFGIEQARRYGSALEDCFMALAKNPLIGRSAEQFAPGLRRFEHGSHTVFYRPDKIGVFIIRILNERVDIMSHLS